MCVCVCVCVCVCGGGVPFSSTSKLYLSRVLRLNVY